MAITTSSSMSVKALRRSKRRLAIRRTLRGDADAFERYARSPDAVVFQEQFGLALEWPRSVNRELYGDRNRAAGWYHRRFAMLQTEAAVWPSLSGHAEDTVRLAGSIPDAQFQSMGARRLFAEVLLWILDDQYISILPAVAGPDQAKAAPSKQHHGEQRTEPGNLGKHVQFPLRGRFGAGPALR